MKDLTGLKFSRFTVISLGPKASWGELRWYCVCDCGEKRLVIGRTLKQGTSKSCGCLQKEVCSARSKIVSKKHGMWGSPTYKSWASMIWRCKTKTHHAKTYTESGISVCERWGKFINFFEDMGERPSLNQSIDRIDNTKGYYPENCRWATHREQANNKRNNHLYTRGEVTKTISEWSRFFNIDDHIVRHRIIRGWDTERSLTTPVKKITSKNHAKIT